MKDVLLNLGKKPRGIVSVCSAHPLVIAASLEETLAQGQYALIECTCNQVNHKGGYTGMTPTDFVRSVREIADAVGFPEERLLLGGDHLGPNPWKHLPAIEAMSEAKLMMRAYADAGIHKLHLDCSMGCAGEPEPLDDQTIANRAVELCRVAEGFGGDFFYIIGTEVPTPGGAQEELTDLEPTTPDAVKRTYEVHREVFDAAGLPEAFARVIAVVVQPRVESAQMSVVVYEQERARDLVRARSDLKGLVYEAHSTDYQTASALRALVDDGFAILKVGPNLTHAMREALYGLELAAAEVDGGPRYLRDTMERVMLAEPDAWVGHIHGDAGSQQSQRHYGLSDRIRYYWLKRDAVTEVDTLKARFGQSRPHIGLLSQYLSGQLVNEAMEAGDDLGDPDALIKRTIRRTLRPWLEACA